MPSVWAPSAGAVALVTREATTPMQADGDGWWHSEAPLEPGTDYAFRLDGGEPLPDPRSPWQPRGVFGFSRHLDHSSFQWSDSDWRGVPIAGRVIYELHIGTFTPQGTFDSAVSRLPHLLDLGVEVVEVMPVAAFDGTHGWGYDGVALYAVHEPYGGPEAFKRFVDAAHAVGLAVMLDVVYNHLGPAGNVLASFGPYFTDRHLTPWGPAVNLDGPGSDSVRRFIIDNALGWCRDYHVDGLRLDAVHALADSRATHLLEELTSEVHAFGERRGRATFVIAESDRNDPRLVRSPDSGGYGLDGTWCDDVHHAIHAALTGERHGYYSDFGALSTLGKALARGYVLDGGFSSFRGRHHGRQFPVGEVSGHRLVAYCQTHDQVGNRARGERLAALVSHARLRVAAVLVATSAFTPMLFMGEEWGARTPWQYFTSFSDPALAEAVRQGRRQEFAGHGWPTDEVADPQAQSSWADSVLDWSELEIEANRELLAFYRRLLSLRREVPELADGRLGRVRVQVDEAAGWLVAYRGESLVVVVNLGGGRAQVPIDGAPTQLLLASAHGFVFADGYVELDEDSAAVLRLMPRKT